MTDQRTMAYINLFGVLGTLPYLCELDENAAKLIEGEKVTIGIKVKGGPEGRVVFEGGKCTVHEKADPCTILLTFPTPEKFNGMIDGTYTPIPRKGFHKIGFLTGKFIKLTDILSAYLRADKEALKDDKFFDVSTSLMFHLILSAIAQIGNEDKIGKASASYIVDGTVRLSAGEDIALGIVSKDHRLTAIHDDPDSYTSYMSFKDIPTARALFDGEINSLACIGTGLIRVGGMISQVDNVNRILDRVALYLA